MNYSVKSDLPTKHGDFLVYTYKSEFNSFPHLVMMSKENAFIQDIVDVRIHSECMTGDVFGSSKCDCGEQLDFSMKWVHNHGGLIIYLRQEGRGIGLENKLKAYNLQNKGFNTREANIELGFHSDSRDYKPAIDILEDLSIQNIRLITNNPEKIKAFANSPIRVLDRIPIEIKPHAKNIEYLRTKKFEMGHMLSLDLQEKIIVK